MVSITQCKTFSSPRLMIGSEFSMACRNWLDLNTRCSGPQTVSGGLANKGGFRLTFYANKWRPGLTITANEPTFCATSLQTAR